MFPEELRTRKNASTGPSQSGAPNFIPNPIECSPEKTNVFTMTNAWLSVQRSPFFYWERFLVGNEVWILSVTYQQQKINQKFQGHPVAGEKSGEHHSKLEQESTKHSRQRAKRLRTIFTQKTFFPAKLVI